MRLIKEEPLLKKALLIYSLLLALITCAAGDLAAQQASAQATYMPVTGGYRYSFTITNHMSESDVGYYVYAFDTYLNGCADIYAPGRWYGGLSSVYSYWSVLQVPDRWRQGVGPGKSLGGFAVTAPSLVERVRYRIVWSNDTTGGSVFGYAYPVPVPEPSALMSLAGGLGALAVPLMRRKRKR